MNVQGTGSHHLEQSDLQPQAQERASDRGFTRRKFMGTAAAVAGGAILTSRSTNYRASAQSSPVRFWDMVWGSGDYINQGKALAEQFSAEHDFQVTYESVPWEGEYEKFAAAIAANAAPNASSGPAFQPWQFWSQGALESTEALIAALEESGVADDFVPGTMDLMKYEGTYIGVPFNIDIRVMYYRKSLLEQAGVEPPTTWDELLAASAALKEQNIYGLSMQGRPTQGGWQAVVALMINNGGGYLNAGIPEAVTDTNIETLDFFNQMVKEGYIDPASIQYSSTDANQAFGSGRAAFIISNPGFDALLTPEVAADMGILSPLTSPRGTKGTLFWVNPLMIYKQPGGDITNTNVWLEWYIDHMEVFWEKSLIAALPVRTSWGSLPSITENPFLTVSVNEWIPVAKTAGGGNVIIPQLNAITQGTGLDQMTQQIIQGSTSSQEILETLQSWLEETVSS